MENALQTIQRGDLPMTAGDMRAQVNLVQEVMKAVMRDGEHYGKVPGCGDKPTLLQPGAQKLVMTFRLVPDAEITIVPMERGHREVRCKVSMYARGMNGEDRGPLLGIGIGTCSTMEGKYRYRTGPVEFTDKPVPREYWDLRSKDPAKAKAMLGGAGFVAKKDDSGMWMIATQGEKVEHDNPADYYNTVEKMSFKRALVSATLNVTAASDIFTQDIEDMPEVTVSRTAPRQEAHDTNAERLAKVQEQLKAKQHGQDKASTGPEAPTSDENQSPPSETLAGGGPGHMTVEEWSALLLYLDADPDRIKVKNKTKAALQMKPLDKLQGLPPATQGKFVAKLIEIGKHEGVEIAF